MSDGPTASACPNCGATAPERFCPRCGQDNRHGRLLTGEVVREVLENLLGWESALGHTLRGLARSPGSMVAEYAAGRRRRFVNPVRFCLLSLALWFLATRALSLDPMDDSGIRITASSGGEAARIVDDVRAFLGRHLDVLLFLSLPLQALLLRAFFRGMRRNLAECLVLVLYVAGVGFLGGMLLAPLVAGGHLWAVRARPVLTMVYLYWAVLGFFGKGWLASAWRVLSVSLLHMLGTFLFFGIVAVPWVLLTR